MKRLSFIFLLILFCSLAKAQFLQLADGPVFPDSLTGFAKILQMKNGNTMYLDINFNKGLYIHVYDALYHVKTETNIEPAYGNLKAGNIEGIFEINGDAVVMISNTSENEMVLYRLIIDGKTGKLKEEKQVAMLNSIAVKKWNSNMTDLAVASISVRKDPNNENYAVALINNAPSDSGKKVEIILYGIDHKEINRAYYPATVEKYKYLRCVDMVVIGADKVALLLYGFNMKDKYEKEGELILVALDKGTGVVTFKELNFSSDMVIENGITRYDPNLKKMILLFTAAIKSKSNDLNAFYTFLDPYSKTLETITPLSPGEKVKDKYAEIFGKKALYSGFPQNLFINDDRSFTVIFEELDAVKEKDSLSHTSVSNIAVVTYNYDGGVTAGYFIPMSHYISNIALPSFYQSNRGQTAQLFLRNNQYKSYCYISDGHNSYVLFNNTESNGQAGENGKIATLTDVKYADAFFYHLEGNSVVPKRQYVFGKPSGNEDHKPALFTVFDYDKANNIFVTLKVEKEGSHPGVKLVWLQP